MSNNELIKESKRITNILIDMKEDNKDLESIVKKIIKKEYKNNIVDIMLYIPNILAENKYSIESISPFEIKKNEI